MGNISIIFTCTLIVYLLYMWIDNKMTMIKFRIREREFARKHPIINRIKDMFIGYVVINLIFIFTIIQNKMQFIRIPISDPIVLTVAIYTMYGIFISFIQFLISYSSTNNRDIFWGRSKTKLIIMDSMEYRVFNSTIFRILLLYLSIYSVLDFNKIFAKSKYCGYADSLFFVSIIIIMIEFIVLFIKGVMISNVLFYVQEDGDRITSQIKSKIFNQYKSIFNKSLKPDYYDFAEYIFADLSNVEKSQRGEMLYLVMCHVYSWYEWTKELQDEKILIALKRILKITEENSIYRLRRLHSINTDFWNQYEQSEIELPLEKLITIYKIQENLMFNLIQKESGGNKDEFTYMFEKVYNYDNTPGDKLKYFCIPKAVWKTISSQNHVIKLCDSVRDLQIMKMLYRSYEKSDYCCTDSLREKIIKLYCDFIIKVINKEKEIIIKMNNKNIEYALDIGTWKEDKETHERISEEENVSEYIDFREEIKKVIKHKLIVYFIQDFENNELNQSLIKKLSEFMEVKYIMFFITYRILYTGPDYYNWKREIIYFKGLISSRYYEDNIVKKHNVDFVAKSLAVDNIGNMGHRISYELIQWIFHNLNSSINEKLVMQCTEREYLNLATFISFKYIFKEYSYFSIEDTGFIDDKTKFQFIMDMSEIKGILKEKYFIEVLYSIFGIQKDRIEIGMMIRECNFEAFLIASNFIHMKTLIDYINTHELVGTFRNDGLLNFLVIKSCEFEYQRLFDLFYLDIKYNLVKQLETMLCQTFKTLDEYVDDLCTRASYLGNKIPQHRRDKAIHLLSTLIFDKFN